MDRSRAGGTAELRRPEEVLRWLTAGDPLGLARACRARQRLEGWFVDPRRLLLLAMVRVALLKLGAARWGSAHGPSIARAASELLVAQQQGERLRQALPRSSVVFYRTVARRLGLQARTGRRACVWLNGVAPDRRRLLYLLLVEGEAPADVAARFLLPLEDVRAELAWAHAGLRLASREGESEDQPGSSA